VMIDRSCNILWQDVVGINWSKEITRNQLGAYRYRRENVSSSSVNRNAKQSQQPVILYLGG
jgi:hypothetical protein